MAFDFSKPKNFIRHEKETSLFCLIYLQIQPGQIPQSFHNQPQQMYPGYHPAQQQHPQMTSTTQQPNTSQEPINPNDLSLI